MAPIDFTTVDYLEVGRKVHEMVAAHGEDGTRRYAARLAADALADDDRAESDFWRAVESCLTPR